MSRAQRGEIWLVDLGMVAKTRPVLILSVDYDDKERALVTYVARTTSVRGTRFEVPHAARGFDDGAFDAQGLASIPDRQLLRRLGVLDSATLDKVEEAVRARLGLLPVGVSAPGPAGTETATDSRMAKIELFRLCKSGERIAVSIEIARPGLAADGVWRTPILLTGLGASLPKIYGQDSFQSLCLTMAFIRTRLRSIVAQGDRLTLDGEEIDFPIDAYFPQK